MELVVLDSSPFLRCVQTAAEIAAQVGIGTLHINYLLSEWLKDKFYPYGDPIDMLEIV